MSPRQASVSRVYDAWEPHYRRAGAGSPGRHRSPDLFGIPRKTPHPTRQGGSHSPRRRSWPPECDGARRYSGGALARAALAACSAAADEESSPRQLTLPFTSTLTYDSTCTASCSKDSWFGPELTPWKEAVEGPSKGQLGAQETPACLVSTTASTRSASSSTVARSSLLLSPGGASSLLSGTARASPAAPGGGSVHVVMHPAASPCQSSALSHTVLEHRLATVHRPSTCATPAAPVRLQTALLSPAAPGASSVRIVSWVPSSASSASGSSHPQQPAPQPARGPAGEEAGALEALDENYGEHLAKIRSANNAAIAEMEELINSLQGVAASPLEPSERKGTKERAPRRKRRKGKAAASSDGEEDCVLMRSMLSRAWEREASWSARDLFPWAKPRRQLLQL